MNIQNISLKNYNTPIVQQRKFVNKPSFTSNIETPPTKKSNKLKYVLMTLAAIGLAMLAKKTGFCKKVKNFVKEKNIFKKSVYDISKDPFENPTKLTKKMKKKISQYMDNLKAGENVDPLEIEKIMTDLGAFVREEKFVPSANISAGRKKVFTLDGFEYTLETHRREFSNSDFNPIVRFYNNGAKQNRNYLTRRGTFQKGSYSDAFSHIDAGLEASNWMTNAKVAA